MIKTVEFQGLKLAMGTKEKIQLERALGNQSPLNFIFKMVGNGDVQELDLSQMQLPSLEFMVTVLLHASQKLNHGINQDKMFDLVDAFLDEPDNSVMLLLNVVMDVLKQAKYLPEEEVVEEEVVEKVVEEKVAPKKPRAKKAVAE